MSNKNIEKAGVILTILQFITFQNVKYSHNKLKQTPN